MKKLLMMLMAVTLVGCSSMKVAKLDPKTGRFPSQNKATIVKSEPVKLDKMNSLILVPDNDFFVGQMKNIQYFGEIITLDDLETLIIQNDLTDKVPYVRDKIGINKAFNAYKEFLWLRFDVRKEDSKKYAQLILTKPDTLEDIFITETILDYQWRGVNDNNTWYPLFNSIVDYIDANSDSWQAPSGQPQGTQQ